MSSFVDAEEEEQEQFAAEEEVGFTDWQDEEHFNGDASSRVYFAEAGAEGEGAAFTIKSIFCTTTFSNIVELLAWDKERHNFDWHLLISRIRERAECEIDEVAIIAIINFLRKRNDEDLSSASTLFEEVVIRAAQIRADESFLKSHLTDDPLLYTLPEALLGSWSEDEEEAVGTSIPLSLPPTSITTESEEERETRLNFVRRELGLSPEQALTSDVTKSCCSHTPGAAVSSSGKPVAGETFPFAECSASSPFPPHSWGRADHSRFNVRIGPNYERNKKKAPSASPLYEIFAVDVFATEKRVDHVMEKMYIPELDSMLFSETHPHVPGVFVVQVQIPSEKPPMFR